MKPEEFVIWLKGFVAASNTYNITPSQYDTLVDTLKKVKTDDTPTNSKKQTDWCTTTSLIGSASSKNNKILND